MMSSIMEVGKLQAHLIIKYHTPIGLFWMHDEGKYIGIDNRRYEAYVEQFDDKEIMMDWLNDKFEMSELEQWKLKKLTMK